MTKAADKSGKQGSFINELKAKPGQRISSRRFFWREPLATPRKDTAHPDAKLGNAQHRERPSPEPTADLPKTTQGTIDVAEVKQDLASQLKASRARKRD